MRVINTASAVTDDQQQLTSNVMKTLLTCFEHNSHVMRTAHSQEASLNYNENSSLPMSSPRLF